MTTGFEAGGRYSANPIGSEHKSTEQRKASRDPGLTPTELHRKSNLMRQFMKNPEGGGVGNSEAYRNGSCWDASGRLKP